MTLYVILIISSLLIGMAISVYAFGTGGKRAKVFKEIYYSIEEVDGKGILYTKTGEYSATLAFQNPVQKNCADANEYGAFSSLLTSLMATLGDGYSIHKQDVFVRRKFQPEKEDRAFLSESYFRYFTGREYTDSVTYLTITQENKKSRLFSYDEKKWNEFIVKVGKVKDQLSDRGVHSKFLTAAELRRFVSQYLAQDFASANVSLNSFSVRDDSIGIGQKKMKAYSLVDVDNIIVPTVIRPYANVEINNISMPVDLMSMLDRIPGAKSVVYNQVVYLPNQKQEMGKLAKKKNRHSSLPSPSNQIAVEDIKKVEELINRENKQLVYCHFSIMVTVDADADLQKCTNYLENAFSRVGIQISQRAYNQLELFVGTFPGNCYALNKDYDRFLTLSDAASCLMCKERMQRSENTPLKICYTDRQGVPVAIDITGKEGANKLTDNSNFFCLGPSGSGKSFHMNSVVRQLHEQGTDVVMVDTGHSYKNLCEYLGGKYLSYTMEKPISMNPFQVRKDENEAMKIDFLTNLILIIWKDNNTADIKPVEMRIIHEVITAYYECYFSGTCQYKPEEENNVRQTWLRAMKHRHPELNKQELAEKVELLISDLAAQRKAMKVEKLNFNSFFEFSVDMIEIICQESDISGIDYSDYRKMLSCFYKGKEFEHVLNEDVDTTLFDETFIVFEIDSIKDHKLLFPIVTLIIMDVFLQKMVLKKNRKALIIEEAWKAIASPLMAEYIKYLYKTCRKFWGMVGVVTQELQDIVGSPIVKEAIINNSDITILMDQGKFKERFDDIKAVLSLTDVECRKIFTINRLDNTEGRSFFREVFIRRGLVSDVYGVEEAPECYMSYTTERQEKDALELYKQELRCSPEQAIAAYCNDWRLSGISSPLAFARDVHKHGKVLNLKNKKANKQ